MTRKPSQWPWFGLGALAGLVAGWQLTRHPHRTGGVMETGNTGVQQLNDISETLLLPLAYRAFESRRPDALIHDPKAAEIVAQLAYDFSKLERQRYQQLNIGLRVREFDRAVRAFLEQHPDGVVVDIGCGLDTRFERVDNGQVMWFNLDFPEVMALRERFFAPHARCHSLACSALEFAWMDEVAQQPGPYFFLAEGVFPYIAEDELKSLLLALRDRFPGSELMFDMLPALLMRFNRMHPAIRQTRAARVRWATNDSRAPEKWGVGRLLADWRYYNHDDPRLGWRRVFRYIPFMRDFRVLRYQLRA
ncbi:MAG TPA: class I SAM-dependent methyltransferase [Anaerolineae bacterium]|nr:class I SAM-dependent methyltransferase [Anaerolineae bacterium]